MDKYSDLPLKEDIANARTLMNTRTSSSEGKASKTVFRVTEREKALVSYIRATGDRLVSELRTAFDNAEDKRDALYLKKLIAYIEDRCEFSLKDLVEAGFMTKEQGEYLKECMIQNKNIILTGQTGCGKTTLLNSLLELQSDVRMLVVEEIPEIKTGELVREQAEVLEVQSTKVSMEDMAKLLSAPVRRLVVGEVRNAADGLAILSALAGGCSVIGTAWNKDNWKEGFIRLFDKSLQDYAKSIIDKYVFIQVHVVKAPGVRKIVEITEI